MDKDISEKRITIIFRADGLGPSMSQNFKLCLRDSILHAYGCKHVKNYRESEKEHNLKNIVK
jgi:hypothetical protein